ncbi:MAG TPA: carboxypeptidase regulatory-like domain-containing protein, partial [Pyrinomonadaceae bacterium]|nr:carboxypeptidase regulatory-like domain-containing protein [Pyrinomonadaceae bacterium]
MRFRRFQLAAAVLLAAAFAATGHAQTSRGTVSGTVTDPAGAVVSGAAVELVNKATNFKREGTTNDSGIYRFDAVDLGTYDLTIRARGFRPLTNTGVQVQANQVATIDSQLEIGTEQVVVDVTASSGELLLQKTEPVRGGNFSTTQVTALPISTLNPYDLGRLLPGVVTATGGSQFGNASQFSINGQRPRGNNYLIDGTENNDISVTGPANQINNEDAIAEVSVQTGLFSAEFGRAGGGVFNVITKSGSNDYHGTLRWLLLSQRFNALTNNDRLSGLTKPSVFTENVFGGTFGGPLPLPHFGEGGPAVESGKDRTFFFFGLQYDRFRSTTNFGPFRVPTANGVAQSRALFPAGTNPRVDLYLDAIGAARGVTSLNTIALGTGPNGAGASVARGSIETGLIGISAPSISNDRQWVTRVDHKISNAHQLAFRYTDDDQIFPATAMNSPFFTRDFAGKSRNFLVTHTWVMNPTLTNELRVSPYGLIDFTFPISPGDPPLAFTLPNIAISGLSAVGIATNIPQFRTAKNYLVQDTMTKVAGSHTFRFGGEFLKQTAQQRPPFNERGSFSFATGGGFTGLANYIDNFSGSGGSANINFGQPVYDPSLFRQSYFVQDTWRTTPNLTLTLGVRYENFGQPANRAFKFPAFAGFNPADFLVPNKVERDNNNFGPIVGLAFTPTVESGPLGWLFGNNVSVIRAGYQVSYDTFFNNLLSNIAADSPNNTSTTT